MWMHDANWTVVGFNKDGTVQIKNDSLDIPTQTARLVFSDNDGGKLRVAIEGHES